MSIIAFVETYNRKIKKSAYEVVSYAKALSVQTAKPLKVVVCNVDDLMSLAHYGADDIIKVENENLEVFLPNIQADTILTLFPEASVYVFSHTNAGSAVAAFVAVKREAALLTNVVSLPTSVSPLRIRRKSFSGKGIMHLASEASVNVITILPNAVGAVESPVADLRVENRAVEVSQNNLVLKERIQSTGKINLKDADIVVSGGRGLKGPENWKMVEELAELLGAATACSKPVADMGWRPHGEHVGQTGLAIAPHLYIAVGISGAIQHLAGVNTSKRILVINNDAEAPFFKAADYGICADAFEVVPQLIEKIRNAKQ